MTFDSKMRAALMVVVLGLMLALLLGVIASAGAAPKGTVETQGPVYGDKCDPCHANIGTVYVKDAQGRRILFFKHAFHILVECSACHTDFPHKPDVVTRPKMKSCWACHKLTHSAGGEIARGNCTACHPAAFVQRATCPFSKKVANWSGAGHAKLGKRLQKTDCAMCHPVNVNAPASSQFCIKCHQAKGVKVKSKAAYDYDEGSDCLVCHQVKTISKYTASQKRRSFYVDNAELVNSVHTKTTCQGCHSDFNFMDKPTSANYKFTASLACETCHPKQRDVYQKSIHGEMAHKGRQTAATCGACHGGHDIFKLNAEGKAQLSKMSFEVCGGCHANRYRSYDDYYHGAAYKTGAADAPNCWTCHGAHDVLPAKYAASKVSSVNLSKTCSQCKPHDNAKEDFTAYAPLIHRTKQIKSATFISQLMETVRSWLP